MTIPLYERSIVNLIDGLAAGDFTSRQLVQAYLDRISTFNDRVNAFVSVLADEALEQADIADRQRCAGNPVGTLAGIPIVIKDSVPTAGIRTTSNSRVLKDWIPKQDALAVHHLRRAGAIVLGKTNLNEFGWALPSVGDLTPIPMNPWNPSYAAIGSSSGSGIAVAAGFAPAAIGTDGGGSTRLPAGQHNLISLKGTHGAISREGMDASWVSEIAPMTRTVADTALLFSMMATGNVERDLGRQVTESVLKMDLDMDISGWKLGVPRRLIDEAGMEDEVSVAFEGSLDQLRSLGVELVDVEPSGLTPARMANFVILNAQAHTAHGASLRAQGDLYGHSARLYHWAGAFLSATDLLNAKAVAVRVQDLLEKSFGNIRAIVTPTSPVVTAEAARNPDSHRKGSNAVFTAPFNATGHPAISIPSGFSASTGLPIGLQLVGPLHDELTLLRIARALERMSDWEEVHASFTQPSRLTGETADFRPACIGKVGRLQVRGKFAFPMIAPSSPGRFTPDGTTRRQ